VPAPAADDATAAESAPPVSAPPTATAAVTPGPRPAAPATSPSLVDELLGTIEAFRGAYERKDLAAVLAVLSPAVRERNTAGRPAVEQMYSRNFAVLDGIQYELSQFTIPGVIGAGPMVVHARFRIRARHLGPPVREMDVRGPIRWMLERENGALRIVAIDYEMAR
jgi:hypothetical protein